MQTLSFPGVLSPWSHTDGQPCIHAAGMIPFKIKRKEYFHFHVIKWSNFCSPLIFQVSTPCNAIVFNAGGFTIKDMAGVISWAYAIEWKSTFEIDGHDSNWNQVGIILNLLCICSTMVCLHTYGIPLLGIFFSLTLAFMSFCIITNLTMLSQNDIHHNKI